MDNASDTVQWAHLLRERNDPIHCGVRRREGRTINVSACHFERLQLHCVRERVPGLSPGP